MAVEFYIEKDLKECERLWNQFSPQKNIGDLWVYRLCFHLGYGSEPYFIVGRLDGRIVGFIPLEFSESNGGHIMFGCGDWNENNAFYIDPDLKEELFPEFLKQVPAGSYLCYLRQAEKDAYPDLIDDMPGYYLSPADYDYDLEKYLATFSPKTRQTIKRQVKKVEDLNWKITENNFADFDSLVALNKKRFGAESVFEEVGFEKSLRRLIASPEMKDKLFMFSWRLGGELKGVYLLTNYRQEITALQGGNDTDIDNLSKYINWFLIKDAFAKKAQRINFMSFDCGWKEHWQLQKEMMYKMK